MIFDLNSLNFTYGVQTVIAVSVLIALILFARKHVARQFGAGVAYALWAIPLARLVLPPLSMPTPLAGFFAKWHVFLAAIEANLYVLSVIGVLASAVSAFYYLRVVKVMFFDEPTSALDPELVGEVLDVMKKLVLIERNVSMSSCKRRKRPDYWT